jgi:hypothetical protein
MFQGVSFCFCLFPKTWKIFCISELLILHLFVVYLICLFIKNMMKVNKLDMKNKFALGSIPKYILIQKKFP